MTCTTHHYGCDCREAAIQRAIILASVYTRWDNKHPWACREFDALVRQIYGGEGVVARTTTAAGKGRG